MKWDCHASFDEIRGRRDALCDVESHASSNRPVFTASGVVRPGRNVETLKRRSRVRTGRRKCDRRRGSRSGTSTTEATTLSLSVRRALWEDGRRPVTCLHRPDRSSRRARRADRPEDRRRLALRRTSARKVCAMKRPLS